jgi:methyl coenzyme M reductase subunit C
MQPMDLETIKEAAKRLVLVWPFTDDDRGWAIQVIMEVLTPLCGKDKEIESIVKYIEEGWGLTA